MAFRSFAEAKLEQFGGDPESVRDQIPALVSLRKLEEVPVEIEGLSATWPANPKSPIRLTRMESGWKIDHYSSFQDSAQIDALNVLFEGTAEFVEQTARDVQQGKFSSHEEAQAELQRQQRLFQERIRKLP